MSIDVSKIGYGAIVNSAGDSGVVVSRIGYGIIIDTLTPEPAAAAVQNFMSFIP